MSSKDFARLTFAELTDQQQNLVKKAEEAIEFSHSPYSKFEVGAALMLADGTVIKGSNQENIAYPSGICAERSALFAYGSGANKKHIKALAVVARHSESNIWSTGAPCGACRQVMLEYERLQQAPFEVIFRYENDYVVSNSARSLLPFDFHMEE